MNKAIQDIKVNEITIEKDTEGKESIKGTYSLLAPSGAVLAKQRFNGYNDVKIELSDGTKQAAIAFVAAFKTDLNNLFGFGGTE